MEKDGNSRLLPQLSQMEIRLGSLCTERPSKVETEQTNTFDMRTQIIILCAVAALAGCSRQGGTGTGSTTDQGSGSRYDTNTGGGTSPTNSNTNRFGTGIGTDAGIGKGAGSGSQGAGTQ